MGQFHVVLDEVAQADVRPVLHEMPHGVAVDDGVYDGFLLLRDRVACVREAHGDLFAREAAARLVDP